MAPQGQQARQQQKSVRPVREQTQPTIELPITQLSHGTVQRARLDPARLTPVDVMALQGVMGNQAVVGLLGRRRAADSSSRPVVQPKLEVGPIGDRYEQEADRVADQVTQQIGPAPGKTAQKQDEEELQMKPAVQLQGAGKLVQRTSLLEKELKRIGDAGIGLSPKDKRRLNKFISANTKAVKSLLDLRTFTFGIGKRLEPQAVTKRIDEVKGRLLILAYNEGIDEAKTKKRKLKSAGLVSNWKKKSPVDLKTEMADLKSRTDSGLPPEIETGKEFWEALNEPKTKEEYLKLAKQAKSYEQMHIEKTEGGKNKAFLAGTSSKDKDLNFFAKNIPPASPDTLYDSLLKAELEREVFMPLIARGLGIETLPLAARAVRQGTQQYTFMEKLEAKNISQILDDIEKGQDDNRLDKIKDEQLQKTIIFDMLFENKDAHIKQYMIGEGGNLFKIDQGDYLSDEQAHPTQDAKAGSFLAGLPQANRMLRPSVAKLVRSWSPERLQAMMRSAQIFSKEEIQRVLQNLKIIKSLVNESQKEPMSIRELFEKYNKTSEAPKDFTTFEPTESPAVRYNYLGTRLKWIFSKNTKEKEKLAFFEQREQQEVERAKSWKRKTRRSRGRGRIKPPPRTTSLGKSSKTYKIPPRYRRRHKKLPPRSTSTAKPRFPHQQQWKLPPLPSKLNKPRRRVEEEHS